MDFLVLSKATESPLQTLWLALDKIEKSWDAFFLHPIDFPLVNSQTLNAMLEVYKKNKPKIVQPRYENRGGHPVLINTTLSSEIRKASPEIGLRQVIRADP